MLLHRRRGICRRLRRWYRVGKLSLRGRHRIAAVTVTIFCVRREGDGKERCWHRTHVDLERNGTCGL